MEGRARLQDRTMLSHRGESARAAEHEAGMPYARFSVRRNRLQRFELERRVGQLSTRAWVPSDLEERKQRFHPVRLAGGRLSQGLSLRWSGVRNDSGRFYGACERRTNEHAGRASVALLGRKGHQNRYHLGLATQSAHS